MKNIVVEKLPLEIDKGTVITITDNTVSHLTHGIHKYPGKFIPQIPEWALCKYENKISDGYVLDPFCGSGTTLLECSLKGIKSIGIDIDPLSCMISKVKTTPIDKERLEWLLNKLTAFNKIEKQYYNPKTHNLDHWFSSDSVRKLGSIRSHIESIYIDDKITKDEYDLLIIIFSSIIRKVSNADNRSQKTYVSHTRIKKPSEVFSEFSKSLNNTINDVLDYTEALSENYQKPKIFNTSSTNINEIIDKFKIELVITSPPYIKSIDYVYNQMAELFWIGDLFDLDTQEKQNKWKRNYLGAKNILKQDYSLFNQRKDRFGIDKLDETIKNINLHDPKNGFKHAYIVHDFFKQIEDHLGTVHKCLESGGIYIMVVGNSSVSDFRVKTDKFISEIGERIGFEVVNYWSYEIRNRYMNFDRKGKGGIIDQDHVIEFQKR